MKVEDPIIPLHLFRDRTTALATLASIAVGVALFGSAVFLGQYFQLGCGYSPTIAGLLTRRWCSDRWCSRRSRAG